MRQKVVGIVCLAVVYGSCCLGSVAISQPSEFNAVNIAVVLFDAAAHLGITLVLLAFVAFIVTLVYNFIAVELMKQQQDQTKMFLEHVAYALIIIFVAAQLSLVGYGPGGHLVVVLLNLVNRGGHNSGIINY
jgi:hypothetical protein